MADTQDITIPKAPASDWTPGLMHCAAALLVAAGFFVFRLAHDMPLSRHEALIGQLVREMRASGDWLVPTFCGEPRLEKPPLAQWVAGAVSKIGSRLDARTLRLGPALIGVACMVLVWAWAGNLFGARVAWLAMVIFASMGGVLAYTHHAGASMLLAFWCTLSVYAFERGLRADRRGKRRVWLVLFYVSLGVAMLAKWLVPLAIVAPALLAYLFVTRRLREIPRLFLVPGLLCFVAAGGWWAYVAGKALGFDAIWLTWQREFAVAFPMESSQDDAARWYFQFEMLALLALPWTFVLPEMLAAPYLRRYADRRQAVWLLWCLLLANVVIFTCVQAGQSHHLVPVLPAAAVLAAVVVDRILFCTVREENGTAVRRLLLVASVLIVVLAVGAHRVGSRIDAPSSIALTAVVGGAGLLLALWCYGARWPRASVVVVGLAGAIAFTTGRASVGRFSGPAMPDYTAFAARIRETLDIESVSAMRWLSEPDPRLVFHTHQTYDQVLPDLEILRELRDRRLPATEANAERLVAEAALTQLDTPEAVVAVARAKLLEAKVESTPFLELAHTVYRHPSFDGDPDDDLVVFVNEAGARLVRTREKREIEYPVATTTRRAQP